MGGWGDGGKRDAVDVFYMTLVFWSFICVRPGRLGAKGWAGSNGQADITDGFGLLVSVFFYVVAFCQAIVVYET